MIKTLNLFAEVLQYMELKLIAVFYKWRKNMEIILYILLGLVAGVVIGRFMLRKLLKNQELAAQNK